MPQPTDSFVDDDGNPARSGVMEHESNLPDIIERREDGALAIRGHRVTLGVVLEAFVSGEAQSEAELHEMFPTVEIATFTRLLEFIRADWPAVWRIYMDHRKTAEERTKEYRWTVPTLDELRLRRAARRENGK